MKIWTAEGPIDRPLSEKTIRSLVRQLRAAHEKAMGARNHADNAPFLEFWIDEEGKLNVARWRGPGAHYRHGVEPGLP